MRRIWWLGGLALALPACNATGPVGLAQVTEVSVGMLQACARQSSGQVVCWGGDTQAPSPQVVPPFAGATTVSVGDGNVCALFSDGTIHCQLGPSAVIDTLPAAAISLLYSHSCALSRDGTIQCWGSNTYGELGIESNTDSDLPVLVVGLAGATGVSVGENTTCAALADGTARCWGANTWGQLGDGTKTDSAVPVAVAGLTGVAAACTGSAHSCALLADGSVRCWGANAFGQLGDGTRVDSVAPVAVAGIASATALACGWDHTCVVSDGGLVRCWGANGGSVADPIGALGTTAGTQDCLWAQGDSAGPQQSTAFETPCAPAPVQVTGVTDAVTVAAGYWASCAVVGGGLVKCWGWNLDGQLGNGSTQDSVVPVTVTEVGGK